MFALGTQWFSDFGLTTLYPTGSYAVHNPSLSNDNTWVIIGSGSIVQSTGSCVTPTTTTTTTTTSTTTTTTTSPDIFYLAERYQCSSPGPGCTGPVSGSNVTVVLSNGASSTLNYFHNPVTPDGYVYKLISTTTGPASVIVKTAGYAACNDACENP
jgi:hypothetical protein